MMAVGMMGTLACCAMSSTPGSIGCMIRGVFKQECEYLMYSFNVMLEGKNVCRMGDPLWHNKKNICG